MTKICLHFWFSKLTQSSVIDWSFLFSNFQTTNLQTIICLYRWYILDETRPKNDRKHKVTLFVLSGTIVEILSWPTLKAYLCNIVACFWWQFMQPGRLIRLQIEIVESGLCVESMRCLVSMYTLYPLMQHYFMQINFLIF